MNLPNHRDLVDSRPGRLVARPTCEPRAALPSPDRRSPARPSAGRWPAARAWTATKGRAVGVQQSDPHRRPVHLDAKPQRPPGVQPGRPSAAARPSPTHRPRHRARLDHARQRPRRAEPPLRVEVANLDFGLVPESPLHGGEMERRLPCPRARKTPSAPTARKSGRRARVASRRRASGCAAKNCAYS